MRSTKSIRRDIQLHATLFIIALGIAIFFVIACFAYATLDNLLFALLFLLSAAFFGGRGTNFHYEHREATKPRCACVETKPVADYSDH